MITLQQIKEFTENYFECEDLRTKSRKQDFVFAKNMAFYLARKYTDATTSRIGKEIADKDHATVLHSLNKFESYIKAETLKGNPMYPEEFNQILKCETIFNKFINSLLEEIRVFSESQEKFKTLINHMINNDLKDKAKELNDFLDDFMKHLSN